MTRTFEWTKLWGIDTELGNVHKGDVVEMRRKDGTTSHHEVGATMPYLSRKGERRVMALLWGEEDER